MVVIVPDRFEDAVVKVEQTVGIVGIAVEYTRVEYTRVEYARVEFTRVEFIRVEFTRLANTNP